MLLCGLLAMQLFGVSVVILVHCIEQCSGLTGRFCVQGVANRNGRGHIAIQS